MKTNIKKLIRLLSTTAFLLVFVFVTPASALKTGSCGPNTVYTYDNGMLTISGDGGMKDYGRAEDTPWYKYRDEVTAIIVTEGVTGVGNLAFYDMKNLYSATFPDSLKAIGNYAFSNCERLTAVSLPSELRSIGQRAFERCISLTSIKIPSKVKSVGSGAFYRCTGLSTITLPKSVENIGDSVFAYCTGLLTAEIKCNIDTIPLWMFYGCDNLTELSFDSAIKEVGENALTGCESLDKLTYNNKEQDASKYTGESTQSGTEVIPQPTVAPEQTPTATTAPVPTVTPTPTPTPASEKKVTTTDNAVVTVTKPQAKEESPVVDAIIENDKGVNEVVQTFDKIQSEHKDVQGDMVVNIQLKDSNILSKSILKEFAGTAVTLNVTTKQNHLWIFDCSKIADKKLKDLDLSVTVAEKLTFTDKEKNAIGSARSYSITFRENFQHPAEVRVYLGLGYARRYASLFIFDEVVSKNLRSVLVDNAGRASFAFSADSVKEGYVIGMDIENKNIQRQAYIPQNMQGEYTGLVDEYGTRYVVTGRSSSTGMELAEFTRYVVVGFIAIVVVIGSIVYVISKSRRIKQQYRNYED